jgi:hypothetical protein
VAVSGLDPFEGFEIAVWPAPLFEGVSPKDKVGAAPAKAHLGALERLITADAVANSRFKAILNETTCRQGGSRSKRRPPSTPASPRTGSWNYEVIRTSGSPDQC